MLYIIPILLFTILCLCLPQILLQTLIGFVGYCLCRAVNNRNLAKMTIIITIFACLNFIVEKANPMIKEINEIHSIEDKIKETEESVKKPIDKKIDKYTGDNWLFKILTDYPNDN